MVDNKQEAEIAVKKKVNWKEILAILFIAIAIYFFWKQRGELATLGTSLLRTNLYWLSLGIFFTVIYILLQAGLYVYSFKAVKGQISWPDAIELFAKRNLIAVFVPGGGLTALAYLPSKIKQTQKNIQQVHHASLIYGFIGIFSVFIVAVPVLLYLSIQKTSLPGTTSGFITMLAMLIATGLFVRSVQVKGKFYQWVIKGRPKVENFVNKLFSFELVGKQFFYATVVSVFLEFVGVVHVYLSMLAAGVEPSLEVSIIGYIIATIFLIISPFLRGMGAIEVSLTFILNKYDYATVHALLIALLFRFFEFWLPLLAGVLYYLDKGRTSIVKRFRRK